MSLTNRENLRTQNVPVYTVYPGQLGNANYEFHDALPQAPPPKYEDVISGEYLRPNYTSYNQQPSNGVRQGFTDPHTVTSSLTRPNPSDLGVHEEKNCKATGAFLFALVLTVIFVWRICIKLS